MKTTKLLSLLSLFLLACNNSNEEATSNSHLTLYAHHSNTRTATSSEGSYLKSSWTDGDQLLTSINKESITFNYDNTDPYNSRFTSTQSVDNAAQYQVFALYPTTSNNEITSISSSSVEVNIGSNSQSQNGTSPAHIAALDPLYGSTTTSSSAIYIKMNHSATVLKINVKNTTDSEIAGIKNLTISTPDDTSLYGSYSLNLSEGETSATSNNDNNSISVAVTNSGAIADNGEFSVWAAAAPFAIKSGEKMIFTVTTDDDKEFEVEKGFTKDVEFSAGKVMETTIELPAATPQPATLSLEFNYTDIGVTGTKNNPTQSGTIEYTVGNYKISIISDVTYYKNTSDEVFNGIRFSSICNSMEALISLPMIAGYKLTQVSITTAPAKDINYIKNGVVYKNGTALKSANDIDSESFDDNDVSIKTDNSSTQKTNTYDLPETNSQTQYYIRTYGTTTQANPCTVVSFSLEYALEN